MMTIRPHKPTNSERFQISSLSNSFRYKLIRILPATNEHLEYLRQLYLSPSPYFNLDFWQPPSRVGALVDVTVPPTDAAIFVRDLEMKDFDYTIAITDLEQFDHFFCLNDE
jgi:hypothetical protein